MSQNIINFYELPLDDKQTYEFLATGKTQGVFQLESGIGRRYTKELGPTSIEDLSALGTILRPGSLEAKIGNKNITQLFCDRKNGREPNDITIKCCEDILGSTNNLLIYQEQILSIVKKLAGFSLEEADLMRRCVTSDTKFISKTRGYISIDELLKTGYTNDQFLVMNEDGKQSWQKISKIWSTGKHDVRKVVASNGLHVWATKNHQFLTADGWKARVNLSEDDYLVCASSIEYDGEDLISKDLALIIAGLLTEGHFVETASTFTNFDPYMMKIFTDACKQEFNVSNRSSNPRRFLLRKRERDLIHQHLEYGLSKDKVIPSIMMRMTKETTRQFLSFMLACEGGISHNQFEYVSKSESMIHQVQLLLLRFGVKSYIVLKRHKKYGIFYRLYVNDHADQTQLLTKLTCLWPQHKIIALQNCLNQKLRLSYTSDILPGNILKRFQNQYPGIIRRGYTKNHMSRRKFRRIALQSKDKKWIEWSNNKQYFGQIKSLDERQKQVETFDFSIENESTPYIIANGLVIHNCVGKKDVVLMSQMETKFLEGCKKVNLVSEEEAKVIFEMIRKSQRYLFNKCLTLDTMVCTPQGHKELKDLKVGDQILAPNSTLDDYALTTVTHIHDQQIVDVFETTFASGCKIKSSITHKFLTENGKIYTLSEMLKYNLKLPARMNPVYSSKDGDRIIGCKHLGMMPTIDITVDNEHHLFYANHIAVSNSHAYSYGVIGYWTAWCKVHYPLEFFCAYLEFAKEKMNPKEEIRDLVDDMKSMNISIRIPSLIDLYEKKTTSFFIDDKNHIVFGVNSIKGIGESQVKLILENLNRILELTGKKIGDLTWFDFLRHQKINKTAITNLITVGLLDNFGVARKRMLYEYNLVQKLSPRELKILDGVNSLEEALSKLLALSRKEGGVSTDDRREIVGGLLFSLKNPPHSLNDDIRWIYANEVELLGTNITCSPLDWKDTTFGDTKCVEFSSGKKGKMTLNVEIIEIKEYTIKNEKSKSFGQKMGFVKVSDDTGKIDCLIFDELWETNKHLIYVGNTVVITGYRSKKDTLIIEAIGDL